MSSNVHFAGHRHEQLPQPNLSSSSWSSCLQPVRTSVEVVPGRQHDLRLRGSSLACSLFVAVHRSAHRRSAHLGLFTAHVITTIQITPSLMEEKHYVSTVYQG